MIRINFLYSLLALMGISLAISCGERTNFDGELTTSLDNAMATNEFAAIRNMVDLEATLESSVNKSSIYCPNADVSVTTLNGSTVMFVNFANGSVCLDGRLRTGRLKCTFSGKWGQEGTLMTIEPEGYNVDGWAMDFTKTIRKLPRNTAGNIEYEVKVTDGAMINSFGTINFESEYTAEWVAGENTPAIVTDNEYLIEGSTSGVARSNLSFTAVTNTPLRIKMDCAHAKSGTVTIDPEFFEERSLDYGEGLCDNVVVFKVGDYQQVITLP